MDYDTTNSLELKLRTVKNAHINKFSNIKFSLVIFVHSQNLTLHNNQCVHFATILNSNSRKCKYICVVQLLNK